MSKNTEAIRQLVARYDPAGDLIYDEEKYRASADLISGGIHTLADRSYNARSTNSRRFLLRGLTAVASAGALAIVAIAVQRDLGDTSSTGSFVATPQLLSFQTGGTNLSVREVLERTAASAERQPDTAGAGRYQYVETRGWYLDTRVSDQGARSAVIPVLRRQWIATDGSGRVSQRSMAPYFPSASSRKAWQDSGQSRPQASDESFGPRGLHLMWRPGSLSSDITVLRRQLAVGHPSTLGPAETFVAVNDLYNEQPVGPELRAAILRLLATLPGLRYDGTTVDRAGREGVAISTESDLSGLPTQYVLVFDPASGQLLDSEQILNKSPGKLGVPIPSVIAYTVYLDSRRTNDLNTPN